MVTVAQLSGSRSVRYRDRFVHNSELSRKILTEQGPSFVDILAHSYIRPVPVKTGAMAARKADRPEPIAVSEIKAIAKTKLEGAVWDYYITGADGEDTVKRNEDIYKQ